MKCRSGFVSNSSSSSFIVAFAKKPKSVKDVEKTLYPDGVGVGDPYGENHISATHAAEMVWDQIKDQRAMSPKKVAEEISNGYYEGHPDYPFHGKHDDISREYYILTGKNIFDTDAPKEWREKYDAARRKEWDDYETLNKSCAKKLADRLLEGEFKGKKLFSASFSDDDGPAGCTMEHGNAFRNVPYTQISHH